MKGTNSIMKKIIAILTTIILIAAIPSMAFATNAREDPVYKAQVLADYVSEINIRYGTSAEYVGNGSEDMTIQEQKAQILAIAQQQYFALNNDSTLGELAATTFVEPRGSLTSTQSKLSVDSIYIQFRCQFRYDQSSGQIGGVNFCYAYGVNGGSYIDNGNPSYLYGGGRRTLHVTTYGSFSMEGAPVVWKNYKAEAYFYSPA